MTLRRDEGITISRPECSIFPDPDPDPDPESGFVLVRRDRLGGKSALNSISKYPIVLHSERPPPPPASQDRSLLGTSVLYGSIVILETQQ
jgi:hypothetical protein